MSANSSIQKIAIEVDRSTFAISTSGSITGSIVIRTGEIIFPEAGWRDFPVAILSHWLEPVSRIFGGKSHVWECLFMDGPYTLRLEKMRNDTRTIRGLYDCRVVEFSATVSSRSFLDSLLAAAVNVLSECHRRGWKTSDIENLDSAIRNAQCDTA